MLRRLVVAATCAAIVAEKIPVVLVADVGIDDAAALLWLLRSPSIELLGIAASFGCHGDVRQTAANARRVLRAAGKPCVPVHVGSRVAFGNWAPNEDDGKYIHGADGCGVHATGAGFQNQDAFQYADWRDTTEWIDTLEPVAA